MQRFAHLLIALLLAVFATGFAAACGDEDDPAPADPKAQSPPEEEPPATEQPTQQDLKKAGVDPITGAYQGLELDTREGPAPPSVQAGSLPQVARAGGCTLRLNLRDEGADHLEEGDPVPEYGTDPATSGDHEAVPAADGAYLEAPPEQNVIHSLEHGRVAVQYSQSLPDQQQLLLKGLFDADPDGVLLFANPHVSGVAVTAWRNLMTCENVEDAAAVAIAVAAFRDRFRGKGPERIPL